MAGLVQVGERLPIDGPESAIDKAHVRVALGTDQTANGFPTDAAVMVDEQFAAVDRLGRHSAEFASAGSTGEQGFVGVAGKEIDSVMAGLMAGAWFGQGVSKVKSASKGKGVDLVGGLPKLRGPLL